MAAHYSQSSTRDGGRDCLWQLLDLPARFRGVPCERVTLGPVNGRGTSETFWVAGSAKSTGRSRYVTLVAPDAICPSRVAAPRRIGALLAGYPR